jgi:NAD(P)-dependent dehydrogenase (short-subunit alcohol dehydrogenase family)
MRLKDKIAIVVGAGQSPGAGMGNGRATVLRFAREGAKVLAVDNNLSSAEETVAIALESGGECTAFEADVTREATLAAMVEAAQQRWGRVDILHYNVGVSLAGGDAVLAEFSEAAFDRIATINLRGAVRHRRVGDIVVTAISDGSVDGGLDVLRNIDQEEARRILAESFRPAGRTPINAFLLYSAGRLALVETGSGNYLGLTAGKVLANIAAAGVDPASIETVLLYHMHPDHSAGLSDGDRTPLFLQRRTGRARERTAALVRRRRHGEGVRAPAAALFHVCAGADHAVQGPHASVSKGRCVSGRHRHPVPRPHAGAHVVPHQFRQRATADLGRHGARAGDPDRTSGSAYGVRHRSRRRGCHAPARVRHGGD